MLDRETAGRLIPFFEELLEFYKKFLKLEEDKYGDLKDGRFDRLDGHMKEEQAYVLRAKGLEQERMKLLEQTPSPDAPFRELIPLFPEELQERIRTLYEELSSVLLNLKQINEKSSQLTKQKLRRAAAVVDQLENRPELQKLYGEKLGSETVLSGILSKKV